MASRVTPRRIGESLELAPEETGRAHTDIANPGIRLVRAHARGGETIFGTCAADTGTALPHQRPQNFHKAMNGEDQ